MKEHLSSEAMEQALAGDAGAAVMSHLKACAACAQELTALRRVLGGARESAVVTAEQQRATAAREQRQAQKPRMRSAVSRWQGWALGTCAVVMLAVGLPIAQHKHGAAAVQTAATATPVHGAADALISDEALLNDVASDLSTSVPQPLAPLMVSTSNQSRSSGYEQSSRTSD